MDRHIAAALFAPALVLGACVPQAKYDAAVNDGATAHAALTASLDKEKAAEDQIAKLQKDVADLTAQLQDRDQKLSELTTSSHNVQAQLDEQTAINAKLRAELERLGKNVDSVLKEKGTIAKALDDAKARLEELRKAQAAAEARAELFRKFVEKFKSLVDAGQLKIETRAGRLVLQLPNDVLFDTGSSTLKPATREKLAKISGIVLAHPGLTLQIEGHTDSVGGDQMNQQLSERRADSVRDFLISQGVAGSSVSAQGFGKTRPVASNDTAEGRQKNRRVELVVNGEAIGKPGANPAATTP